MRTMERHPKIRPEVVYLGDNGRAYCGDHLGAMATATMRDLSGQSIEAVTPDMAKEAESMGVTLTCEQPGCGRTPSTLHLP